MRACFLAVFVLFGSALQAQVLVYGKITDRLSGDPVESALITAGSNLAASANDGSYTLKLEPGEWRIVASKDGFAPDTILLTLVAGKNQELHFGLDNLSTSMQAVQITASVAKDRKTPIAYTNISGKNISERLGSADMPVLLNTTPGVYATQQGGGAGDARISIRGFNQRNIAVMVDGIPVNDMENGEVYWSNWYGLSDVTAVTQVQRGLGSSRIANPAVGGTMNIITKGIGDKFQANAGMEFGDSRYRKFSVSMNSGKLPGNYGVVLAFTSRTSAGYVDGLYDDMFSYFIKLEKDWGSKGTLSFTAMGAPQSHGQRSFRARLSLYDTTFAKSLNMDTAIGGMPINQGRKYNQHIGYLYNAKVENGDTSWGAGGLMNERENMFHKPQYYLKYDRNFSKRVFLSTVAYASVGKGGGTASLKVPQVPSTYGYYDFQSVYFQNTVGTPFVPPIDPAYSDSLRKSFGILYRNVNNHNWFGLLSTVKIKWNDFFSFIGGIDLRTYKGQHWREVYDLIGGQYFHPGSGLNNPNHPGPLYFKGDIFQFHNDGLVRWGGVFGEAEYSKKKVSAFVNISTSNSWYRRIDYFKLDTNGGKTNWISRTGATFKTGLNYNFNRHWNAYTNLGYLNRPTRFNNIFDNRNREVKAAKNEIVYAAEGGIGYKSRKFTMDANAYYTLWQNRPLNTLPSFRDLEGNLYSYNINGLAARHVGLEIAAVWKPLAGITLEGVVSMADWIWTSGSRAIVYSDAGDSIGQVDFDARGVHVGDAAQQQLAAIFRWEPRQVKGLYLSAQWVRFSKHYADFEPTALVESPSGNFKGRESYLMPAYWYLNLSGGYKLPWIKKSQFTIYGNIQNVTGNLYISDAQHRNVNGDPATTFNAKNLEVFVSPGLRFTTGMRVTF